MLGWVDASRHPDVVAQMVFIAGKRQEMHERILYNRARRMGIKVPKPMIALDPRAREKPFVHGNEILDYARELNRYSNIKVASRAVKRAIRWVKANAGLALSYAPGHIREKISFLRHSA